LNDIDNSLFLSGSTEIIVPEYMTILPNPTIENIISSGKKDVIFACGYHEQSKNIIFINESYSIFELNILNFFKVNDLKVLSSIPIKNGNRIEVVTPQAVIEIDSCDLIQSAKKIDMSNFEVIMPNENKT